MASKDGATYRWSNRAAQQQLHGGGLSPMGALKRLDRSHIYAAFFAGADRRGRSPLFRSYPCTPCHIAEAWRDGEI
jgi:hypothetical protein